jgi:hypothetical protein
MIIVNLAFFVGVYSVHKFKLRNTYLSTHSCIIAGNHTELGQTSKNKSNAQECLVCIIIISILVIIITTVLLITSSCIGYKTYVEKSVEKSVEKPIEKSVETSVETPVETPCHD